MSREDYAGLHGRSPDYQNEHGWIAGEDHFVPEGWDELNRGICPRCGRTVAWDERLESWVVDEELTVLVVTRDEYEGITATLKRQGVVADREVLERMYDLNRPFVDG